MLRPIEKDLLENSGFLIREPGIGERLRGPGSWDHVSQGPRTTEMLKRNLDEMGMRAPAETG